MHTFAPKIAQSKSPKQTASFSAERTNEAAFGVVDNRPEATTQRKLQEMAASYVPPIQFKQHLSLNNNPQLEQEADTMGTKALTAPVQPKSLKTVQPASNVVQAYTYLNAHTKLSEHAQYRINSNRSYELLVAPAAAPPQPAHQFLHTGNKYGFRVYEFAGVYSNECLDFAEYLQTGSYSNKSAFRARGDAGTSGKKDRLFGTSDNQNIAISEQVFGGKKRKSSFSQGKKAQPGIGEAYATVRRDVEDGEHPFHIAAVVAQDGSDNITCEADASDAARTTPVFDMYAVPKKQKVGGKTKIVTEGETFHDVYKPEYTTDSKLVPITGVLTKS